MQITQTSNNNSLPPILTLPNELIQKIVVEFLPLSDIFNTRLLNKTFSHLIVEVKAQEERKFLQRLHKTLLKSFLFLPRELIKSLEKIEISKNIEHRCTTFTDIADYHKLWFFQVKGILESLPWVSRVWQHIAEPILKQLHPFAPTILTRTAQEIREEGMPPFYAVALMPNFTQPKKFSPAPIEERVHLVLSNLCETLLSLDEDLFSRAAIALLNEKYRDGWGDLTVTTIIRLKSAYGAPFQEMIELAKKLYNVTTRKSYYAWILNEVLTQRDFPLLYELIENLFEESLSPSEQNTLIQILAKAHPPTAIEKALTLQNESVQKQAFIDIFPHLHFLLFQGEAATKQMFTLMEKIKKEDRKEAAFEIVEMFQLIVEEDPTAAAVFWGAESHLVVHMREELRTWNATLWIVEFQVVYQPDKLHACQRAYQILRNLGPQPPPSDYARPFFRGITHSRHESEALPILSYFFEIATSPILKEFITLLFAKFPLLVYRSAPFFTKLDESIQKEEDRLWIEQQLLTTPSGTFLMPWLHMVKRFCRNSDKKDETITSLLIKLQKQAQYSTLSFFNDPDMRSFFEEIKSEAKRLEVRTALSHEDSFNLMADTLSSLLKKGDPITPFLENHQTTITQETKYRLLANLRDHTGQFLQEGLITLDHAIQWANGCLGSGTPKTFLSTIDYFNSLIEEEALHIEELVYFLEKIENSSLRDEGLARIALFLDEKRPNLEIIRFFPLFANMEEKDYRYVTLLCVISCAFRALQEEEKSAEIFLRAVEQISDRLPIPQLFIDALKSSLLIYQGTSYDSLPCPLQMGYIYRLCYTNMPQALDLAKNSSYKKEALLVLLEDLHRYNTEPKEVFLESLLALHEEVPQEERDHPPLLKLLDRLPFIMKSSRRENFLHNFRKNIDTSKLVFLLLTQEKKSSAIEIVKEALMLFPDLYQTPPFRWKSARFTYLFLASEDWVALEDEESSILLDFTYQSQREETSFSFTWALLELKVGSNFSKSPLMIIKVAEWISKFKPYYENTLKKKLIEFLQTLPPEMREELKERSDCIRNLT